MKTKILKAAGIALALITCLTVFGLNFSRVGNKPGNNGLNLSVLNAKAQSGEDCTNGGANGSWVQTGIYSYSRNGRICSITNYTFYCNPYGAFICDAYCYAGLTEDVCN